MLLKTKEGKNKEDFYPKVLLSTGGLPRYATMCMITNELVKIVGPVVR